jgi:hypothetical protein
MEASELPKRVRDGLAGAFEVWRWPAPDCLIVVLTLETPEQGGRDAWHDVLILDIEKDVDGWRPGQRGVRWTISTGYGWERVL